MSETSTWGIIGPGGVGSEVRRQLAVPETAAALGLHTAPEFVMRSSGLYDAAGNQLPGQGLDDIEALPSVVFIATPTTDDGTTAYGHISTLLDRGSKVVTAEKGAMANYFPDLHEQSRGFRDLGIGATVGGGTRLLHELREYTRNPGDVNEIHLALNGTLAAIMSAVGPTNSRGMSLEQAVQQAVELGYAEPGSTSPLDVLRGEAEGDIPKKVGILFNVLGLSEKPLDWNALRFQMRDEDIARAAAEAATRRFIVSIYPIDRSLEQTQDVLGGFRIEHEDWQIVGGFQNTESNPLIAELARGSGPANGFSIGLGPNNRYGVYSLNGPGAGVGPTANTMLNDAARMLGQ